MSNLPSGEAIFLAFVLVMSALVIVGLCLAAWVMSRDEGGER